MYRKLLVLGNIVCLLLVSGLVHAYVVDGSEIYNPNLFQYVKNNLPKTGTLKATKQGFVYVDIDEHYVTAILKQLKDTRYAINSKFNHVGTHISVMLEDETKGKHIKEFGRKIKFSPLGFYNVVVDDKEYFMLAIDAPELAKIREKYGLSPKLDGHTFNITIGVRQIDTDGEDELAEFG